MSRFRIGLFTFAGLALGLATIFAIALQSAAFNESNGRRVSSVRATPQAILVAANPTAPPFTVASNTVPASLSVQPQPISNSAVADSAGDGNIPLTGANNAVPLAVDDSYTTSEDTPLKLAPSGILSNDTEANSNGLSTVLVSNPANGTLTLNPNGSLTYTPNINFTGSDSFTYQASSGLLTSNTATVTITVARSNDPPTAHDDQFTTVENTVLTAPASGVLANDGDGEEGTFSAVLVSNPANGSLTLNADGSFIYSPDADFSGVDSFTYQASGGTLISNIATAVIVVMPINNPPVVADNDYTVRFGTPLTIPAPGLLASAKDPDGDQLSALAVSNPTHGSLTLNDDGSFTYIPNIGYRGTDSFTYTASDGVVDSLSPATVTLRVRDSGSGVVVNNAPIVSSSSTTTTTTTAITPTVNHDNTPFTSPAQTTSVTGATTPTTGGGVRPGRGGRLPGVPVNVPAPPPATLCTDTNFENPGIIRSHFTSDADRAGLRCRLLTANGQYLTWFGFQLTNAGNIGNRSVLDLGVVAAVDVFSPIGAKGFVGDVDICLQGKGYMIYMDANGAPRVPQLWSAWTTSAFPGYTCTTLYAPGTVIMVTNKPQ